MRPNLTCPVCDHGATDAASIRVHNLRVATDGERSYPFGRGWSMRQMDALVTQIQTAPKPERPAEWLNREFGAFAPSLAGRVNPGER